MFKELPTVARLLQHLQRIPYLASKNVYHVVEYFLRLRPDQIEQLCLLLAEVKKKVGQCDTCFAWHEYVLGCTFCMSTTRDKSLVCVVETWQELLSIERTNGYTGVYHVLGGVISPLDGVGPEHLTINQLLKRVETSAITEVVLATNQTPEGEATAAFIATKLASKSVKLSCLARGLPVGSSLDAMDRITVYKALSERRAF